MVVYSLSMLRGDISSSIVDNVCKFRCLFKAPEEVMGFALQASLPEMLAEEVRMMRVVVGDIDRDHVAVLPHRRAEGQLATGSFGGGNVAKRGAGMRHLCVRDHCHLVCKQAGIERFEDSNGGRDDKLSAAAKLEATYAFEPVE